MVRQPFAFFTLLLPLVAGACGERPPVSPPPVDSAVVHAYADRLVLEEERRITGMDSLVFGRRLDDLAAMHGFDTPGLDRRIDRYRLDPAAWKRFYEEVAARLDSLRQAMAAHRGH